MSKKPAPPPGVSGRTRQASDLASTSNSRLLLAGLDQGLNHSPAPPSAPAPTVITTPPVTTDLDPPSADLAKQSLPPPDSRKLTLNVPPVAINSDGADKGLLLSPRSQVRKADISGLQLRDAPPVPPKRSPVSSLSSLVPPSSPAGAKTPTDFTHAIKVLSNAYEEIISTVSDIEEELVSIKDTTELRDRKATIRIVVTLKQLLESVPLPSKERREARISSHSKEVLLLVFYKNTEDSLWVIRQKLNHLHSAIQNAPAHSTLVSVGHLFRSLSQTLAMYDAKSTAKRSERLDRPKSADLSQQVVKMSPTGSHLKLTSSTGAVAETQTPTPPASPSTHTHMLMLDRNSNSVPLTSSPSMPNPASVHPASPVSRLSHRPGRVSSVTLVPRVPVGPTSPSRPLVPPPPSDFEIYQDEQGEDLIRSGTYSALVYLLTHPDFEQGLAGMQAFILVHRYQHTPGTLFNILETIYDEVVLRKFSEGPATATLVGRFFCVWIEFALMPEFLIHRRTIPSWPLSLYDRLLLFLQKLERNGQLDESNMVKLACLRTFHQHHHIQRVRRQERRRLCHRYAFIVSSAVSTDSNSGSNVERLVKSLDRQVASIGAPLSPSSSQENVSVAAFIRSGTSPYPSNNILSRLSPPALAEQLTIKEMLLFRRISDREFVTYKTKMQPKDTFIGHMVTWFNVFSHSVAGEVLSCLQPDARAELIGRFIDTGVILRSHGNYNGVMEILAALNLLPVSRLTKSWQLVSAERQAAFKELENVMDSRSNFQNYRREFAGGGVKLPYMGIFSRDCVFLNEANADLTQSQLWNWEKILLKGKQVYLYKRLQHESTLAFPEIEDAQVAFNALTCPDVDELYNMSTHLEPRRDEAMFLLP